MRPFYIEPVSMAVSYLSEQANDGDGHECCIFFNAYDSAMDRHRFYIAVPDVVCNDDCHDDRICCPAYLNFCNDEPAAKATTKPFCANGLFAYRLFFGMGCVQPRSHIAAMAAATYFFIECLHDHHQQNSWWNYFNGCWHISAYSIKAKMFASLPYAH